MNKSADNAHTLARHAARLKRAGAARSSRAPFALALFTDERAGDPVAIIAGLPRLPHMPLAVIFRHYDAPDRAGLGRSVAAAARAGGHLLLVAGDAALAARLGADGLHLPQGMIERAPAIRRAHPGWIITAACHDAPSLARAARAGADAAFLSPVFSTASHPDGQPLGPRLARVMAREARLPVLALGGVTADTASQLAPPLAGLGAIDGFTD